MVCNRLFPVSSSDFGKPVKSPLAPLAANREKIRISLGVKPLKTPESTSKIVTHKQGIVTPTKISPVKNQEKSDGLQTPKLVMKIQNGKSFTIETSPNGERRILSDDDEVIAKMNEKRQRKLKKRSSLVPYGDDSSSDSDWSVKGSRMDKSLNTTTSVPGNPHLMETITMKDRVSHTHADSKIPSPRILNTPMKRHFMETLSCNITPYSAKHTGNTDWTAVPESVKSPVGSSHSNSSVQSNHSTSEWEVTKTKPSHGHLSSNHNGWMVTPNRAETTTKVSSSQSSINGDSQKSKYESSTSGSSYSSPYQVDNGTTCLLNTDLDRSTEDQKLHKKNKKHKKHKKHKHEEREKGQEYKYTELDESSHKKKKKKKKHKHKVEDHEEDRSRDDSREEVDRRKHPDPDTERSSKHRDERPYRDEKGEKVKHRKRSSQDEEESPFGKRRREEESSPDYEWVEKVVPKRGYTSAPGKDCNMFIVSNFMSSLEHQ